MFGEYSSITLLSESSGHKVIHTDDATTLILLVTGNISFHLHVYIYIYSICTKIRELINITMLYHMREVEFTCNGKKS